MISRVGRWVCSLDEDRVCEFMIGLLIVVGGFFLALLGVILSIRAVRFMVEFAG